MLLFRPLITIWTLLSLLVVCVSFSISGNDREKRDTNTNDLLNAQKLLRGFLRMSADVPLTPQRRSNLGNSRAISYKINDRTEYAANKKILNDVFESDMVLTTHQMQDVIDTFEERINGKSVIRRKKRKAIIGKAFRWPNQTIPYVLKDADPKWRELIRSGMREWEKETCLKFKETDQVKDHVYIFKGSGCYSSVGRIGGRQYASIGYGCESTGIVCHELGHALGFWHEQSRPDRDRYININEDYIYNGTKGNFEKRKDIENLDIPYDFGSVMHYGPQAFSNDYKFITIETKDHRYQHTIGQRKGLSFVDIKQANTLYCTDRCPHKLTCQHGGYQDPLNCRKCKCPTGLGGTRCETIPTSSPGCGGELLATTAWQTVQNNVVGECFWRISAPLGDRVVFEVLDANYECDSSCADNFLEIKHSDDLQQTGFRQCCNAVPGSIISASNQVLLFSNAQKAPANFTVRYVLDQQVLPKAPPAAWEGGGGLTSLLGSESGIDNTFEKYIFKDLPAAFRNMRPNGKPLDTINTIVTSFLRSAGKK
ncbi:hypothetical protein QR680_002042 [Steinernema hermaphroditum]|uniref:Metalloendopeptidase n=1 Tax=Steinernema hermaphroditum TaxID=289476 RepID=A0AA39H104_9BILA|nr:hypothetical protein QR680_002042 [Steinernema hermaphroditum]